MIKRIVISLCIFLPALTGFGQHMQNHTYTYSDEGNGTGFLKENLFLGGSLNLGFGGYDFNVGGSPEIGYSLNKWLDAGVVVNLNYSSERADPNGYYNNDTRFRNFNYGAGVFGRVYPLPFIFLQVQPEYNWIDYNATYMGAGGGSNTFNTHATSLLLGAGYSQRIVGHANFYIALLFDALSDTYSPYRDANGAALPVIRAGFDFYLHPKR